MVAICAGVDAVRPWAALVIGIIACFAYRMWDMLLHKLEIDDAINAVPGQCHCVLDGSRLFKVSELP